MWIRVSCRRGHKVKVDARKLGGDPRCPECGARVRLWIQVCCPNGHELRVKSKNCGKTGTCPHCKAPVEVPDVTEAVALKVLTDAGGGALRSVVVGDSDDELDLDLEFDAAMAPAAGSDDLATCPRCHCAIPPDFDECPACMGS